MTRYVLEGEWSGYVERQRKIVHREVVTEARAARLRKLKAIRYTDGTRLSLSVRQAEPREKVAEILAYDSLIRDAERTDMAYVEVRNLTKSR